MTATAKKSTFTNSLRERHGVNDHRATFIKGDMYIRDMKHTAYVPLPAIVR
jgi:hypothetical protein